MCRVRRGISSPHALDLPGLHNFTSLVEPHFNEAAIAQTMISSAEGRAIYDQAPFSPDAFIKEFYKNVIGREVDASGLAFWKTNFTDASQRGQVAVKILHAFLDATIPEGLALKAKELGLRAAFMVSRPQRTGQELMLKKHDLICLSAYCTEFSSRKLV